MNTTSTLLKQPPTQFFIKEMQNISIDSVLGDLPSYDVSFTPETLGQKVAETFEEDELLPGIIVLENGKLVRVLSRETFFERVGKRFGTEIYLGRPIATLMEIFPNKPMVLPGSIMIALATQQALSRNVDSIYEPIVVEKTISQYRLISALLLFIAQSHQLMELHQQRLFTVDAGQKINDKDAIIKFLKLSGNQKEFNLDAFIKLQSVRCDHCMKMVNFSIVDVVRSFPQLNRGVVVEEKMGMRSYRMYIRHICLKNEIWEIPVHLDNYLDYRSQRPSRMVEKYA
jgi:hypothetical protein